MGRSSEYAEYADNVKVEHQNTKLNVVRWLRSEMTYVHGESC